MRVRVREARVHLGQLLPLDRRLGSERDVLGDGAVYHGCKVVGEIREVK